MQSRSPFDNQELRHEFLNRLNMIEGVSLPEDSLNRRPSFPIKALASDNRLEQFFATLDWFIETERAYG
jgi:hypothetical protein